MVRCADLVRCAGAGVTVPTGAKRVSNSVNCSGTVPEPFPSFPFPSFPFPFRSPNCVSREPDGTSFPFPFPFRSPNFRPLRALTEKLYGYIPLMASSSPYQIGALNAESFCERVLRCAAHVPTDGNTLLGDAKYVRYLAWAHGLFIAPPSLFTFTVRVSFWKAREAGHFAHESKIHGARAQG